MVKLNGPSITNPNSLPPNNEWDTLYGFAGETNTNSATGEKRTFSEFDIYPKMKGETNEEYGARLRKKHEIQAEYEKKAAKEAYQNSEQGKKEAEITAEFDRLSEKLDQAVKEGKMSAEHAERLKELRLNHSVDEIAGVQQDYQDRQAIGDPEKEAKYRAWQEAKDAENMVNLKKRNQEYRQIDDDYNVIDKENQFQDELEEPGDSDGLGENPDGSGEPEQEPDNGEEEDNKKNRVEIGDINIIVVGQEFTKDESEKMSEIEEELDGILPEITELYTRKRRLIVGTENTANLARLQVKYDELLDEYLRLKKNRILRDGDREVTEKVSSKIEELRSDIEGALLVFAGGNFNNSEKSQEEIDNEKERLISEAKKALTVERDKWESEIRKRANSETIQEELAYKRKLEDARIKGLSNGSICRRIVNKVINNKVLKGVLAGATAAGLAFRNYLKDSIAAYEAMMIGSEIPGITPVNSVGSEPEPTDNEPISDSGVDQVVADNASETESEETTAEAASTQPETDNSAEEWNDLGREFLTSEEGLSEEYADRISEWWAGLSEDLRNDIREYFDEVPANNPHGRALRVWLSSQK